MEQYRGRAILWKKMLYFNERKALITLDGTGMKTETTTKKLKYELRKHKVRYTSTEFFRSAVNKVIWTRMNSIDWRIWH